MFAKSRWTVSLPLIYLQNSLGFSQTVQLPNTLVPSLLSLYSDQRFRQLVRFL